MSTVSYGSITIVDVTDVGEFSVTPSCNQPLNVLYDPDAGSYTPAWASSNLVITPIMYYGGTQVDYSDGARVTWTRKVNSGSPSALTTGETVTNNVLTVSQNKLTTSSGPILTYICTATYTEPKSGVTLTAEGQISFSLVKNASTVKSVNISGDNIIKLDGDTNQPATGYEYVTLTATLLNATMGRWQYKNSSGSWTNYPVTSGKNTSNTSTTLNVYYNEANVFVNDICYLRVSATITNGGTSSTIYDYYQVVLLKDGASGSNNIAITLSNDDQMIPCNSDGTPTANAFAEAYSTVTVYDGGSAATGWTYNTPTTSGVSGTWNSSTRTYTVSSWTGSSEVAYVQFTATKGSTTLTKRFTLTKIKTGADGTSPTIYSLEASALATNKDTGGVFTPSTVVFSAYSTTGNAARTAYSGRFKIYKNGSSTASTTTSTDATSYTYTFVSGDEMITCELIPSGGSGSALDRQTVVVTSDGADGGQGEQGEPGTGGVSVVLGNYAETIMCNSSGNVKSAMNITIPFYGYVGTARAACTLSGYAVNNVPVTGMKVTTHTNGTTSAAGSLVIAVTAGSNLGGTDSGTLSLVFSCGGASITHLFTWSKIIEGEDGDNAVLFQLYAPNGNVISNGSGSVSLAAQLMDGATDATSSATYNWYQWNGSGYGSSIGTGSTLTVTAGMVSSYSSFKCVASYGGSSYTAYYSVLDKTDPIQVSVMSSIGEQIKNRVGSGALYVRVTRNGVEIDPIYGTGYFGTTAPTGVSSGEYWYFVDTTNRTITLKKYNGSSWANSSDTHQNYYTWTFRDADGDIVTSYTVGSNTYNYPTSGKVIFIDGNMVDDKIIADVMVTV